MIDYSSLIEATRVAYKVLVYSLLITNSHNSLISIAHSFYNNYESKTLGGGGGGGGGGYFQYQSLKIH